MLIVNSQQFNSRPNTRGKAVIKLRLQSPLVKRNSHVSKETQAPTSSNNLLR